MNAGRCRGKQITYKENEEDSGDDRALRHTSIDGVQIREEAVDSNVNRPIREEAKNPFNECGEDQTPVV